MKVLSLFDGIAIAYEALQRAGIQVDKYYASEIDKNAIAIAMKNHSDIIQIGDVQNIKYEDGNLIIEDNTYEVGEIDLLIGGSPCTDISIAGKQQGFNNTRSGLFHEYLRLLDEVKPKYFLLENVRPKQEFMDYITERIGVEPIEINSNLVSAQNRRRLYWTNIPNVIVPEDKGIMLKDIIHEHDGSNINLEPYKVPFDKSLQIIKEDVKKGKIGYFRQDSQANRVYSIHGKGVTLCGEAGGGAAKMGQYLFGCITPDRVKKRQNGQRFNDGDKFYTLTAQDRHGILIDGYIRRLTPIEAERLQTLPDNYTKCDGVSDTQRYKCLGNGFTCDVIAHILSYIPDKN